MEYAYYPPAKDPNGPWWAWPVNPVGAIFFNPVRAMLLSIDGTPRPWVRSLSKPIRAISSAISSRRSLDNAEEYETPRWWVRFLSNLNPIQGIPGLWNVSKQPRDNIEEKLEKDLSGRIQKLEHVTQQLLHKLDRHDEGIFYALLLLGILALYLLLGKMLGKVDPRLDYFTLAFITINGFLAMQYLG